MNVLPLAIGALFLAIAVVDLVWTALWVDGGAGPVTSRLSDRLWKGLRRASRDDPRVLGLAGPVVLLAGLGLWVGLLWAGWTLVFAGADNSLIDTVRPGPVSWLDRLYFVGYAMFTLGNGDFSPVEGVWQVTTVATTASGMLFITLIVSYVVSVVDSVKQKRAFAASVTGLGTRADAVVRSGWDGETFDDLALPLQGLVSDLNTLTANHKAYPVLHYFYSTRADQAPALAVPVLYETLTILRFGVPEGHRPNSLVVRSARAGVEGYLETLREAFIQPADRTPPPPGLDTLRRADVPTVGDEAFAGAVDDLSVRRRELLGFVQSDARHWPGCGEE